MFKLWGHRTKVSTGVFQTSNEGSIPSGPSKKKECNKHHMHDFKDYPVSEPNACGEPFRQDYRICCNCGYKSKIDYGW